MRRNAGGALLPQSDRRTAKRARTSAKVSCGARQVLSGGGLASGPFRSQRLVASAPFDSGDPGAKPDDGWRVAVDNLTRKRRKVTAYAICSDATGITYESEPFRARKRERKHVEVDCPDGETALGGGVTHTIRAGRATLVASDNLSRKRASGRAFAICHA